MKIACIGDFHIPERAKIVPEWIKKVLQREKPDLLLCTGDLEGEEVLDWLKQFNHKVVSGNMDWLDLPNHEVVDAAGRRILLMHGTGITPRGDLEQLLGFARKANASILVHGHTHMQKVEEYNNVLFVNPGSACGCWGGVASAVAESFIILELNDKTKVRMFSDGKETEEEHGF